MSFHASKKDDAVARDLVLRAVERNVPCEMQIRRASGELFVIKSRLLNTSRDGIEIDWPTSIGQDVPIHEELKMEVFFGIDDQRYRFSSRIVELRRKIELNEAHRIVGVVLAWPARVADGQRRNDHRVSLTDRDLAVLVHPAQHPWEDGASPVGGPHARLRVVDLSIGGLALIVPAKWIGITEVNRLFFAALDLGHHGRSTVLMEVRQRRRLNRSHQLRVGLKFKAWPDRREFQQMQQDIQRYLVEVQRERLKSA